LKDYLLARLTTWLWSAIVIFVVLLACYTSFGRLLTSNLSQYQTDVLRELNARLGFTLEVDDLQGGWKSLTPSLEARGVRILGNEHAAVGVELEHLSLEIDVFSSIINRSLQLYAITGTGGRLHVDRDPDGQFSLAGIAPSGEKFSASPLYHFIFNAEFIQLDDIVISLHDEAGEQALQMQTRLQRDDSFRRFYLSLLSPARNTWVRVVGEGSGELMDLEDFTGSFHFASSVGQLPAYADVLKPLGLDPVSGRLNAELWLALEEGAVDLVVHVDADEVLLDALDEDAPRIDFDHLAANVRLERTGDDWSIDGSDLELRRGDLDMGLSRFAADFRDRQLIVRTADVEVERLTGYLAAAGLLPARASDILAGLSPRGRLERVQFQLDDIRDYSSWRVEANFSGLGVNPWRSAPGVDNASGYLSASAREGLLQLAASDFSMAFPRVYREPLDYREFTAELAWTVDEEDFYLYSGPFSARGPEGAVGGLFALNIPLVESHVGPEMDLLVGLKDSHSEYRAKYLPYTLSQKLLDWLEPSIGDGTIREGAFIYRGSLDADLPEHRSLQLFFDLADTELDYHPDWPSLSGLSGLVLIDNAETRVIADQARLLDSTLEDIEVSVVPDAQSHLVLGVRARLRGPAADGLAIVNTSPLRQNVGDSFAAWQLDGSLETGLSLQLDLTDATVPPDVQVDTRWASVAVDTGSLGLLVEEVSGQLLYSSEQGFSARDMSGLLWGEPVRANVSQGRSGEGLAELDIALRSRADMDALREWLQLDVLRLAQGQADFEAHILVPPGETPHLRLRSELAGVSLDLPEPWGKPAARQAPLNLVMPLAGPGQRIQFNVQEELYLGVLLGEGGFKGASLGLGAPLAREEPGRFLLGGKVERVDWVQWEAFIDKYVMPGAGTAAPVALLGVRQLEVAELDVSELRIKNFKLDADQTADAWQLSLHSAWLRGTATVSPDLANVGVELAQLDLAGYEQGLEGQLRIVDTLQAELPEVRVAIANVQNGDDVLGNVSFVLNDTGSDYEFSDIRGNLRGLQLGDEQGLRMHWSREPGAEETRLSGRFVFGDFGDVLSASNYERMIETDRGGADIDLVWPGPPAAYDIASARGKIGVDVGEGRFLKTSGTAEGTLRVVGILNLADFVRRLSLDLSYVFQSGVPFDSIQGDLEFRSGQVRVPRMDVKGRSSRFYFSGLADIPESTIDGELIATLPIASNLPWVAALVSGLPAAAAVYLVSKLFTKQMDRVSSAVYSVKGPWADPAVEFERIFDNTSALPELPGGEGEAVGADAVPAVEQPPAS